MKDYKPTPSEVQTMRELRGQSVEEAARSINYTHLSWRQWERGKTEMPPCAWLVYRLGGLGLADGLAGSDKLSVRRAISKVFSLPKSPRIGVAPSEGPSVHEAQEPTGVWDIQEETLAAYWGLGRTYDERVGQAMNGDPRYELVYDDVQSWIEVGPYRKAFADHFGFDYNEEI